MPSNKPKDFINYWEFLGLPMNSPLAAIKIAYYNKFIEIEKSLDNQETKYTPNDLIIVNNAYETLSDPYKRFLHNCQIDDEDPGDILDHLTEGENEQDLSNEENQAFLEWLRNKMYEYFDISKNKSDVRRRATWNVLPIIFEKIALGLFENYENLQKNIEKQQRQNKKYRHM